MTIILSSVRSTVSLIVRGCGESTVPHNRRWALLRLMVEGKELKVLECDLLSVLLYEMKAKHSVPLGKEKGSTFHQ